MIVSSFNHSLNPKSKQNPDEIPEKLNNLNQIQDLEIEKGKTFEHIKIREAKPPTSIERNWLELN